MNPLKSAFACVGTAGALILGLLSTGGNQPATAAAPPVAPIASALPAQAGFGTIKGRLVWGGASIPAPAVLVSNGDKSKKDAEICAPATPLLSHELVVDPQTKGVQYGFAYVVNPKGKNPEAEKQAREQQASVVIDQKNCEFLPYSSAVLQGQSVTFKSSDPVMHNIRYTGFSSGNTQNFTIAPKGQAEKKVVAEKRPLQLICDMHPWMKGYMMVFDHPFFAVTKPDGSFEIHGVPAGTQNLIVWQEKAGYVTTGGNRGIAVSVKPGAVVDLGNVVLDPSKIK